MRILGAPGRVLSLGEVARACQPGSPLAQSPALGLPAEQLYEAKQMTYPAGVHVSVVDVDLPTGLVRLEKYAIAFDVGRAVNPLLVAGQLQGGLAQGIGGALLEELVYSEEGQLLSGTFMDYLLPTSQEVPGPAIAIAESTPSPISPLGAKGAGEGGITGVGGCLANAVADALAPWGAEVRRLPLSPAEVRGLIGDRLPGVVPALVRSLLPPLLPALLSALLPALLKERSPMMVSRYDDSRLLLTL